MRGWIAVFSVGLSVWLVAVAWLVHLFYWMDGWLAGWLAVDQPHLAGHVAD